MADAPTRDAILAELAAQPDAPKEDAPVVEADAPVDVEESEAAVDDETELEAGPDDESPDDDDDSDELKSDDPETQKRFDAVRKAEKRMRAAAERRDADFAARQQEWQAKVDRVAEIEKAAARIKYDPTAVLRAFGVPPEDFELLAQAIYAESPALQNDPKQKAAAQAKLKEREKEEKYSALEKRQAELEAKIEAQKKEAATQAEAAAYIAQVNATAASKFPLVAAMLKADPAGTNDDLIATYTALGNKLRRDPKPAEVVAAFDKSQRARLQKLGIDPATIAKPKAAPAKPANTNTAKPVVNGTETKKPPSKDEILAELAALPS